MGIFDHINRAEFVSFAYDIGVGNDVSLAVKPLILAQPRAQVDHAFVGFVSIVIVLTCCGDFDCDGVLIGAVGRITLLASWD